MVAAQADPVENGIYNVRTSEWARAADFDGNRDVTLGTIVNVDRVTGFRQVYEQTEPSPVIGQDPILWRLWYDSTNQGLGGGPDIDTFASLLDVNSVHDFMYVGTNIDCAQNPFEDWTVLHQVIVSVSNEITLDHELGQDIFFELTENVDTVTFSNLPPSGVLIQFEMHLEQDSVARTITWPASVLFMNGVEIDISTVNSKHVIHFRSIDGGTEWLATYAREFA